MKYKIYIALENDENSKNSFIEADFNFGCGFDSIEEAYQRIVSHGYDYVNYTILPYIYLT